MEILKKHYEKVLLGVVLLGLVVGAVFLLLLVPAERAELERQSSEIINRPVAELSPLELAKAETLLQRKPGAEKLDLSATNKLFNPLVWQKRADGNLIKAQRGNVGVEAVVVTKITPLYLVLTLDAVTESESGARYTIGVEREAEASPSRRRKKQYNATLNNKNDTFVIREARGPAAAPTELIVELNDTTERVSLRKDAPFKRVDGYTADLRYEPEKKNWPNVRVGAGGPGTTPIIVDGESYIVVAINSNEVVLSAKSNNKKTTIPFRPGS